MNDIMLHPKRWLNVLCFIPFFILGFILMKFLCKSAFVWRETWQFLVSFSIGGTIGMYLKSKRRLEVRLSGQTLSAPFVRYGISQHVAAVDLSEINFERSRFGGFWGSRITLNDGRRLNASRTLYSKSEIDNLNTAITNWKNQQSF